MSRIVRVVFAAFVVLASSLVMHAQEMRRSGGGDGLPPYDVARETRVVGVVTGNETTAMQSGASFYVLNISADGKAMRVLVAPQGWVKEQQITFATGATVEATGVSNGMKFQGDPAMMVRVIKIGGKTVTLRSADGTPAWER